VVFVAIRFEPLQSVKIAVSKFNASIVESFWSTHHTVRLDTQSVENVRRKIVSHKRSKMSRIVRNERIEVLWNRIGQPGQSPSRPRRKVRKK